MLTKVSFGFVSRAKPLARLTLAAAVFSCLVVGSLPIPAAAATPGWLTRLNAWRASSGVSALTENPTWSQGDYNHSLYMVKNDQVTHYELSTLPYYTPEGDAAAQNGNIEVSSTTATTDDQGIDWWMAAPFHAMGMMDPRLTQTGFGAYREVKTGWQTGFTLDTLRGNSWTGGTFPVYFPGNGSSVPLTSFGGHETPDPLSACPGYVAPTGLPAFIEVGGNVATTVTAHTFTGNGVALPHCVVDATNPTFTNNLQSRGGVIVIPQAPLTAGVSYAVTLTVNGVSYSWSFGVNTTGWPSTQPPPPATSAGIYTMDGYGGLHNNAGPAIAATAYWNGWNIARAAKAWPGHYSGFTLDGFGGLHPFGTPAPVETSGASGHYWGWDIARDVAFLPDGTGGFVLDGFGGMHPFRLNGNPAALQATGAIYFGKDIACKVVIFSDGTGGYTLDVYGGVHPFGINGPSPVTQVNSTAYWQGWNIVRDIAVVPGNGNHSGYTLDAYGGLHPFNAANDGSTMPAAIPAPGYWGGWDIARGLLFTSATAGYTLDGYGGMHPFGGAPAAAGTYFGWDIAKSVFGD